MLTDLRTHILWGKREGAQWGSHRDSLLGLLTCGMRMTAANRKSVSHHCRPVGLGRLRQRTVISRPDLVRLF